MLILFILVSFTIVFFYLARRCAKRFFAALSFIFLNVFLLELLVYLLFLFQIYQGNSFFLIGQQKFLDVLIRTKLAKDVKAASDPQNRFYIIDKELGYTLAKDQSYYLYKTNSKGMRSDGEYTVDPDPQKLRIVAIGDSFVFGDGEINEYIWTHVLEKDIGNLEVLNFGVSGYGLSQSIKRYLQEASVYHPDIVFLNYVLMNNRDRVDAKAIIGAANLKMSTFYRVHYSVENGKLVSQAVTPLALFDAQFRETNIYNPIGLSEDRGIWSVGFLKCSNIMLFLKQIYFRRVFAQVKQDDFVNIKTNVFLLAELIKNVRQSNSQMIIFGGADLESLPAPIQVLLRNSSERVFYVNGQKMLKDVYSRREGTWESFLNSTDHFNGKGNDLYAEAVASVLTSHVWGDGDRRFQFDRESKRFVNIGPK